MKVERHQNIIDEGWDAAVQASRDTWLFHTGRWIEATRRVWALETCYFLVRSGDRVLGGFAVQLGPRPRRPWVRRTAYSIRMGTGGPFAVGDLPAKTRRHLLAALSDAAGQWCRQQGAATLECSLPPLAEANLNNLRGVNPLVLLGWEDASTHTRILDLRACSSAQASATADARRMTRRALEKGYTVERGDWSEHLDDYYAVHRETYQRTGVEPHPRAYFQAIADEFAPAGQAVLWVARAPGGQPVAYHNCARFGHGACYWTGCSRGGHDRAGVNYLLCFHAIDGALHDECQYYDMGEAFPATADQKLRGLTVFKSKFGGELYRFYRGRLSLASRRPT